MLAIPLCAEESPSPCSDKQFNDATALAGRLMLESFHGNDDMETMALAYCVCLSYIAYETTHNSEEFGAFMKNLNHNISEMYERFQKEAINVQDIK
jgi:meiotically up-regulated gene 157 (Mug157) protein